MLKEIWFGGIIHVPTRPSIRRPPAGNTNDSRSVSGFNVTGRKALTSPSDTWTT